MELHERTESKLNTNGAAAWMSALTNRLPIHMGIDSKSMMDKANLVMKVACRWNDDSRAPWWINNNPIRLALGATARR